jgi:hypothetical protein
MTDAMARGQRSQAVTKLRERSKMSRPGRITWMGCASNQHESTACPRGAGEQAHRHCAGRLAENCNALRITTEALNIAFNPLQCCDLIFEGISTGALAALLRNSG